MKRADGRELDIPAFVHDRKLRELEQQLYGHVLAAIDLDRIWGLEQMVYCEVAELVDETLAFDLTAILLHRALTRVADDDARYCSDRPPGITDAELAAVRFDETCTFCIAEREAAERAAARKASRDAAQSGGEEAGDTAAAAGDDDDEPCACCDMIAESWREEHRETLAKAGLATPVPTPSSSSGDTGARNRTRSSKRDSSSKRSPPQSDENVS